MERGNKNRLLMHICCAPCLIAPYTHLKREGEYDITGFWFNDNIHPYQEYKRRLDTFLEWSAREGFNYLIEKDYQPEPFFQRVSGREKDRCYFCHYYRLKKTAELAKKENFDAFSTTLLYSIYQKHDLIRKIGEEIANNIGISFYYRDLREFWQEGITLSKGENMYRQPYCGCLYSEKERYCKD
ncbi:MAG: epoxyqueuosine reductase QueH [Candidatus Cloacimonetes bacterium]|nr:epoxyqueuosine reductase QueH [Candidatus Cloacimonadota bacterium]